MHLLRRRHWLELATAGSILGCRSKRTHAPHSAREAYPGFRAAHPSVLLEPAPGPAPFDNVALDARLARVQWPGPLGPMHGWLAVPEGAGPFPGLLWLHGSFAVSAEQFEPLGTTFPPPGLAVFVPAWRGENGNPGERELLAGELDDAVAALRWFSTRPELDASQMFALGHSVGGALCALLALLPDLPLRETASVGGIYVPQTFARWSKTKTNGPLVRFDPSDPHEGRLRTLEGNVPDLLRPHIAYVGQDDTWFHPNVEQMRKAAARSGAPFEAAYVEGDHMSSLLAGYARYLARIREAAS